MVAQSHTLPANIRVLHMNIVEKMKISKSFETLIFGLKRCLAVSMTYLHSANQGSARTRFRGFRGFPVFAFFSILRFRFLFLRKREKHENVFAKNTKTISFFFISDLIIFGFSFRFRGVFLRKRFRGFRDFLEDLEIIRVYLMSQTPLFDNQIAYLK